MLTRGLTRRVLGHHAFPAVVTGLAILLPVLAVWAVPAQEIPQDFAVTQGETEVLVFSTATPRLQERSWTVDVPLGRHARHHAVQVGVPFSIPLGEQLPTELDLVTRLLVNGEEVRHVRHGGLQLGGIHGRIACCEAVPVDALREGANTIHVDATWTRGTLHEGQGMMNVTLEPLQVTVLEADADADGVPDPRQPWPGVHSGVLAAFTATFAALFARWALRGILRRRPDFA